MSKTTAPRELVPREFYARSTLEVARELLGLYLVHLDGGVHRAGRIVETEAYQGPRDLAAHSSKGMTARNAVMFGEPGHAYVYFIYGIWNCVNVVTRESGVPHAVLIRALEPAGGADGNTWGPGLLCRALHIDRGLNGADLCGDRLWVERRASPLPGSSKPRIAAATRIGVDYSGDWAAKPWRFYDKDSPYVSTAKRRR